MTRRLFRIVLVLIGLAVTAGLGCRAIGAEQALAEARDRGAALDRVAEEALATLLDMRASMHAYVAPNQGTPFWARKVETQLETLKQRVATLDQSREAAGGVPQSLDGLDQLTAAERRARQYAGRGEMLLAGDVLFTEVRDLVASVTDELSAARNRNRDDSARAVAAIRQEQAGLALAALAAWIVVALALLPTPPPASTAKTPGEWRLELAERLKKAEAAPAEPVKPPAPVEPVPDPLVAPEPVLAVEPLRPARPAVNLTAIAGICADLSALSDLGALSGALHRASDVIGAKGLIIWVASPDGAVLEAVATHGYDAKMVSRLGAVDRDSSNLTADAFRHNEPKVSVATESAPAALAVAMGGPAGPVGVLSVELGEGRVADDQCVAVASIFAAQLATLTAPADPDAAVDAADFTGADDTPVTAGSNGASRRASF
jgi:hypothetical protein